MLSQRYEHGLGGLDPERQPGAGQRHVEGGGVVDRGGVGEVLEVHRLLGPAELVGDGGGGLDHRRGTANVQLGREGVLAQDPPDLAGRLLG